MARVIPACRKAASTSSAPPVRAVKLATLADTVPAGKRWLHEMKYDGYGVLLSVGGGEAVVLDTEGRSSFQVLQNALKSAPGSIDYFAFNQLESDGEDLTQLALTERKPELAKILPQGKSRFPYSDHIAGNGENLLNQFRAACLEGVISKPADGRYVGSRSGGWLTTKCIKRQEFVVVGWTPSDKSRLFRSLILGVSEDGVLRYAGKVGTGFDNQEIIGLMVVMAPLEQEAPAVKAPRAEVRGAHWLRPKRVAEIAFSEMTNVRTLRHPFYLGLHEDKKHEAVVMETEAPVKAATIPARSVVISNPDRVIFPEGKMSKGELADYYAQVAPIMLPWAGSGPISLVRCLQGRAKKCFFQKHDAGSFRDAVRHAAIREKDGHDEPYLFLDTAEGLFTCVQMGTIKFHGWGSRIEDVKKADRLVFDLDPDVGLDFENVRSAAFQFCEILQTLGLETFPMLTGGKGVHEIAPLVSEAEWLEVKDFAHRLAQAVAKSDPEHFTAALPKVQRKGRIFVDYLRNQRGTTAVMPFAVRAREGAPVAVPITWKEKEMIDKPSYWSIRDGTDLVKRAGSKALSGWGRADQTLPDL